MHHECLRDAWVYDTASNAWSSRRMPPERDYGCRWGHTATAVKAPGSSSDAAGGVVAVFGGRRLADCQELLGVDGAPRRRRGQQRRCRRGHRRARRRRR